MSMTRKDAAEILQEEWDFCQEPTYVKNAIRLAITALRGPTREMVERMRGEWETPGYYDDGGCFVHDCSKCGAPSNDEYQFCHACGAPMTAEAVDMMLDRWKEALHD